MKTYHRPLLILIIAPVIAIGMQLIELELRQHIKAEVFLRTKVERGIFSKLYVDTHACHKENERHERADHLRLIQDLECGHLCDRDAWRRCAIKVTDREISKRK